MSDNTVEFSPRKMETNWQLSEEGADFLRSMKKLRELNDEIDEFILQNEINLLEAEIEAETEEEEKEVEESRELWNEVLDAMFKDVPPVSEEMIR
jgi:predicted RNA-binding protein with PUA domain